MAKNMNILIYFPSNSRAIDQQSVMEMLCKLGHNVYLLTWQDFGDIHRNVSKFSVKAKAVGLKRNNGLLSYFRHILYLYRFVKNNNIDVVFAHLESPGLVAAITRWFTRYDLFYFRHNTNAHILDGNFNAKIANKLCNLFSPNIVAVSSSVRKYLLEVEKVPASKVRQINYAFNFQQYFLSDYTGASETIRKTYQADLLLICIGRFVPLKRHLLMFETVRLLRDSGVDVKLMCVGDGMLRANFETYIFENGLGNNIYLVGTKNNVLDYLEAADLLIHFSETESLGMVVLEAGLMKRPAMVCSTVGIFDDFINQQNGFLVSKNHPEEDAVAILSRVNNSTLALMGLNLNKTVLAEFDINKMLPKYKALLANCRQ